MSDHSIENGRAKLAEIIELWTEWETAFDNAPIGTLEEITERVYELPLSIEVRSDWETPGTSRLSPGEFRILLTTGGPACAIFGDLDENGEPVSANLFHQDWFTQWEPVPLSDEGASVEDRTDAIGRAEKALMWFANCFPFKY